MCLDSSVELLTFFGVSYNISFVFILLVVSADEISRYTTINKNNFKPPVSEEVKDIVRRNFTKEIEFYNFCKQRLHKQYLALRLT